MKKNNLVSIIAPVYNTEKHLKQCIESVLRQTYGNWELVMVDDNSPGNSLDIIGEFVKKDNRIKLIANKCNLGVDVSRFKGMEAARGQYLMFLDSDDWLTPGAVEVLVKKMEAENADVVCGAYVKTMDKFGLIRKQKGNLRLGAFRTASLTNPVLFDEFFLSYFSRNRADLFPFMWGRLYRRGPIEKANLKPTKMGIREDSLFNLKLHPFLRKMAFVEDNIVNHRWGGTMTEINLEDLQDDKKEYKIQKEMVAKYDYHKALSFMRKALINSFFVCFRSLLLTGTLNEQTLGPAVETELKDDLYKSELSGVRSKKGQALSKNDLDRVLDFIWNGYKNQKMNYRIKKFIFGLLN